MSWAKAVKEWNSGQIFRDDMYGIPKKGGDYYDDVKEIMDKSKHKKDVEKMMGKKEEAPKIESRVAEEPKAEKQSIPREEKMTTPTMENPMTEEFVSDQLRTTTISSKYPKALIVRAAQWAWDNAKDIAEMGLDDELEDMTREERTKHFAKREKKLTELTVEFKKAFPDFKQARTTLDALVRMVQEYLRDLDIDAQALALQASKTEPNTPLSFLKELQQLPTYDFKNQDIVNKYDDVRNRWRKTETGKDMEKYKEVENRLALNTNEQARHKNISSTLKDDAWKARLERLKEIRTELLGKRNELKTKYGDKLELYRNLHQAMDDRNNKFKPVLQ